MTDKPFAIVGADRPGRCVVICDHASNIVPASVNNGSLGLPPEEMARHIAHDIGAEGVARRLAERLGAPVIVSRFSRLVIDPNRGEDDPTLVMRLYDGTVIEANRHVDAAEIEHRLATCYRPYHAAIDALLASRAAPILVSIHSFTPRLNGRAPWPWQIGVLHASDTRLSTPLLARLRSEPDLVVGDNQPYSGALQGDSMDRHALSCGRPHILIEIRNDLIGAAADQIAWADRLAPIIAEIIAATNL